MKIPRPDYAALRRAAYPPQLDQLDAIMKGGEALEAMRQRVLEVKARYPKPTPAEPGSPDPGQKA